MDNKGTNDKKKVTLFVLAVFALALLISGGTYAYWSWSTNNSQKTAVTFTVENDFTCGADGGGNITSSNKKLAPTDCMDPEYAIQRTITTSAATTGDKVISMDLWLNVNNVSTNLLNSSNFKYAITKNKNSCTSGVINSGVIGTDVSNNKINLLEGVEYTTLSDTYYLYIWLDEAETNHNTMSQSFDFSIGGECASTGLTKALLKDLNTTDYFREDSYKTKITEIHFVYDSNLPAGVKSNYVKTYDLAETGSAPITGYLVNGSVTDTYKLYISSENKIYAQGLENAFNGMSALANITFDNFDTSGTTTMMKMFSNCSSLTSLDVSSFNTSNVTNMSGMFGLCTGLTSLDVGAFNTSSVQTMQGMFQVCISLVTLDVGGFDTSNVQNMSGMFMGHSSYGDMNLEEIIGLEHFDVSSVSSIDGIFQRCPELTHLDLSNWHTTVASSFQNMFYNDAGLITVDISGFNTNGVTNTKAMFYNCTSLRTIYVSSTWNISGVSSSNSSNMFKSARQLPNFNSSVIDKTNAHYNTGGYLTLKTS